MTNTEIVGEGKLLDVNNKDFLHFTCTPFDQNELKTEH